MEIILCIAYVSLFIFIIQKIAFFKIEGISNRKLVIAFLVKVIAGILLGAVYTFYYTNRLTSDTFKFFDDSQIMFNLLFEHPKWFFQMLTGYHDDAPYLLPYYDIMHNWYNKSAIFNDYRTQIRINTILRFISLGYYNVHVVIFSFLSFIGLTALLKLFINDLKEKRTFLYVGVYFLPSVVFWGSGLLKDSLIFFATGISLYYLQKAITKSSRRVLYVFSFLLFFALLMVIKFHNYILLVPLCFAFIVTQFYSKRKWLIFIASVIVYYVVLIKIYYVLPGYGLIDLLSKKQNEFIILAQQYKAQSQISITELTPSFWNAIANTPEALYHSFCRPWFWESKSAFILMAGFENLIILLLIVFCFIGFDIKAKITSLFLLSLFYVFSLFELIGLVTPVMGAMVRYKSQALPFLVFVIASLTNIDLLAKRIPFFKGFILQLKK